MSTFNLDSQVPPGKTRATEDSPLRADAPVSENAADRIDRAWPVLLGAGLCMFCGQPAVVLFTFGTFVREIVASTNWSPVELAAAIAPATILASMLAPFVGRFADKIGIRRLALIGGPAFALGFGLLGSLSVSSTTFIALLAITCGLGFAATPLLYAQLATGWFARRRGLALSLIFACSSLGVVFWSPFAIQLIGLYGWRTAYAVMGLCAGTIISLSALLLLRDPPRSARAGSAGQAPGLTLSEAMRRATFWKILAIFFLITGTLAGTTVNLPVILQKIDIPAQTAAMAVSVAGLAMLIGRLSAGLLLDRWFAPRVTCLSVVLPLLAFATLLFDQSRSTFIIAAMLVGFGLGAELDAAAYIVSRGFGLRAFGAIYGMVTLSYGLASAIGPGAMGVAFGASVAPRLIFSISIGLLLTALVLLLTIRADHLPYGATLSDDARN
ncbi:MFS transporter [Roseiarcaceae bacterium H3SJ34-1]|uniref:MFS transporter n=1 Tax=Terripilifer ovatus TaxID=3032367 RepID=UPI003AB9869F|nr:MFS transporter [Roseiarcaceae bacterium H3SJ34-1]